MEIIFKDIKKLSLKVVEGFYDEAFYIEKHKKKVRDKAEKKLDGITNYYARREIFTVFFAILGGVYIWKFKPDSMVMISILGVFTFAFLYFSLMKMVYKKKIKNCVAVDKKPILNITTEGIEYIDGDESKNLIWDRIEKIVVNNYSMTFFSDAYIPEAISIPPTYKESILKSINEYGYITRVVNNSDKYK